MRVLGRLAGVGAVMLLAACAGSPSTDGPSPSNLDGGTRPGDASGPGADGSDPSPDMGSGGAPDGGSGSDMTPPTTPGAVPEFGNPASRKLTIIGTAEKDKLSAPRDLKFNPAHPEQLWVVNKDTSGVVLFQHPGEATQTSEERIDYYGRHFMSKVSSLSFASNDTFASCQESRDDWNDGPQQEDDFMGPTLWSADLKIFATVNQGDGGKEGSHLDMLHESPLCMGIAWDTGNVYWAFDGLHGYLVQYNFEKDHGPGGSDHSDGIVHVYSDARVKRVADVPSHMILDHKSGLLYVADTGNGRVMRLDTKGGSPGGSLSGNQDGLRDYSKVVGASFTKFVSGLGEPSGIELNQGRIFVSDHSNGQISAYSLDGKLLDTLATGAKGIMGITIGPDGKLWYVDRSAQTVVRVDP